MDSFPTVSSHNLRNSVSAIWGLFPCLLYKPQGLYLPWCRSPWLRQVSHVLCTDAQHCRSAPHVLYLEITRQRAERPRETSASSPATAGPRRARPSRARSRSPCSSQPRCLDSAWRLPASPRLRICASLPVICFSTGGPQAVLEELKIHAFLWTSKHSDLQCMPVLTVLS